ncbi:hypothetical protein AK812_SmicGene36445 [Symbiodinium microadriaticum]|uniref:Uncharacterized protein n=1 Tax=Symbiodinium microadriaticum TaxID=2951 RepID=A0A1Q9CJ18_SYMMI|nr:hypothetical protein AK812_SmicGene36445 [Symbiodinium microadriaticum]
MDDKSSGDSGYGAWGKVPVWDGSPLTWRAFKREMQWWLSSLDAEATKKYNLAARWLLRQSGTVRQRGEEFSPEDLQYKKAEAYTDPDSGELVEISPEDPFFGINRLMDALEKMNGQSTLDKRGELRAQFYIHMCRKPGERVADYASRFRTSISDLRSEGVKLPDAELGWFYKEKLGLDALRKQLLETALGGTEDYSTIEAESLRLFRDLHAQDPLFRRLDRPSNKLTIRRMFAAPPSSSSASPSLSTSSGPSSTRRSSLSSAPSSAGQLARRFTARQAHVSEAVVEEEPEEAPELFVDESAGDAVDEAEGRTLEEVLQTEVEQLAEEIEQAEAEGVDPSHLEALENGIEASAEALVSMREARVKLAEVRKDRGFKGPGFGSSSSAKGRGRGSASIQAKKKDGKHVCFDCGLPGHWAGDEGCTKPGQGLGRAKARPAKSVKIAEVVAENEVIQTEAGDGELREVMMIHAAPGRNLQQAFEMSVARAEANVAASSAANGADKAVVEALDSACNRTCAGDAWIQEYIALLADAPAQVRELIQSAPETERFKFGNGGILPSCVRYRLPIVVAGEMLLVWVSAVPVGSLGLLLGRDFLDAVGDVLDFAERSLVCRVFNSKKAPLKRLSAGHLALPLVPESWPDLTRPRWRKLGPDNVIETLLDCKAWARQLMQAPSSAAAFPSNEPHSHDMTEASLELGRRVFEYNSVLLTSAQKMCCEAPLVKSPAASSATVCSKDGGLRRGTSTVFGTWFWRPRRRRRRLLACEGISSLAAHGVAQPGALGVGKRRAAPRLGQAARLALLAVSLAFGYFGGFLESSSPDLERAWGVPEALAHPRVVDGFDPFLQGMMAVASTKGRAARVRVALVKEAQQEAEKEADRMKVARSLIGPRGGLPTLKADLLRLAALLEVSVSERDKVDDLKAKLKPMIGLLKNEAPPSRPAPSQSSGSMTFSSSPSSRPTGATSAELPASWRRPTSAPAAASPPEGEAVSMSVFTSYMEQMDRKYQDMLQQATAQQQSMLSQVMQHMMQMQVPGQPAQDTVMEGDEDWAQVMPPEPDEEESQANQTDPRREHLGCLELPS